MLFALLFVPIILILSAKYVLILRQFPSRRPFSQTFFVSPGVFLGWGLDLRLVGTLTLNKSSKI